MSDMDRDVEDGVEERRITLKNKAEALRRQISPLSANSGALQALWVGSGIAAGKKYGEKYMGQRGRRSRAETQPAQLDDWLSSKGLKLTSFSRDGESSAVAFCTIKASQSSLRLLSAGRCQYKAISRALFGDDSKHGELKTLAIEFLRLNKTAMLDVKVNASKEIKDLEEAIEAKGHKADYEGWVDALEACDLPASAFTLHAVHLLMLAEIRLVVNKPRDAVSSPPWIQCRLLDPTALAGAPQSSIYLVANQTPRTGNNASVAFSYDTLEEDLSTRPAEAASARMGVYGVNDAESVRAESWAAGSAHTDYTKLGEQLVDGKYHHIIDLINGTETTEDGFRLEVHKDEEVSCFHIYKVDMRTGAEQYVRRIDYDKKQGSPHPKPRQPHQRGGDDASENGGESGEVAPHRRLSDDVATWLQRLNVGPQATLDLAQTVYDSIDKYIEETQLTRGADTTYYIDRLGNQMHDLKAKVSDLRLDMFLHAESELQHNYKVIVAGAEGSGKSTTLNYLIRHLMQSDEQLKATYSRYCNERGLDPATHTQDIRDRFTRHAFALQPTPDQSIIEAAEQEREKRVYDPDGNYGHVVINMNTMEQPDILPTGSHTNGLTALVTIIEVDPKAAALTFRLTYRHKDVVDYALNAAEQIRSQKLSAGDDVEISLDDGGDVAKLAHMACALMGIETSSGDAIEELANHNGVFTLPPPFSQLLGRERSLSIASNSKDAMLDQLRRWLMVHTVGEWSHWGVLEKVEIVLPSFKDDVILTLCDVPGFGDEQANPFRQSIVTEAVNNCDCSTFLICLKTGRLDSDNKGSVVALNDSGVYEALIGEELERKVGQVVTVSSLDFRLERQLNTGKISAEVAQKQGEVAQQQGAKWIEQNFKKAYRNKHVPEAKSAPVIEKHTRSFAVDVTGKLEDKTGVKDYSISLLADSLVEASRDALRRRQTLCFRRLLFEVIMPFYEAHGNLGQIRNRPAGAVQVKLPTVDKLQKCLRDASYSALMGVSMGSMDAEVSKGTRAQRSFGAAGSSSAVYSTYSNVGEAKVCAKSAREANAQRIKDVEKIVISQYVDKNHYQGGREVRERWEKDNAACDVMDADTGQMRFEDNKFQGYRKARSRRIGQDLKSENPEVTNLRDLIMPEQGDIVLPLLEQLRLMKASVIDKVITSMVQQLEQILALALEKTPVGAQLGILLSSQLRKWQRLAINTFDMNFNKLLQTIPAEHTVVMNRVMLKNLRTIGTKLSANKDKRLELEKKAEGCAKDVSKALLQHIDLQIFEVLQEQMLGKFDEIAQLTHSLITGWIDGGDTMELEQLGAFTASLKYARITAGLIKAVHKSNMGAGLLENYDGIEKILEHAEQPQGLVTDGKDFDCVVPPAIVPAVEPSTLIVPSTNPVGSSAWSCPWCQCDESNTPERLVLPIMTPCRFATGCWCQTIDRHVLYCRNCVRYYLNKSAAVRQCTKRTRSMELRRTYSNSYSLKKRKNESSAESGGGKRACNSKFALANAPSTADSSAAAGSSSASGFVDELE
jgi:energy-coupling factor transporter ATP-binding protein EcfA2